MVVPNWLGSRPLLMSKNSKSSIPRPQRRWLKFMGIVCALVFLIAGTFIVLVFHTSYRPAVRVDPAAIEQLNSKLQRVRTERASGKPQTVFLDEADVNALIASRLQADHKPAPTSSNQTEVKNFHVNLRDDVLHVYLAWVMNGQEMSFDVDGKLHTADGYVKFEPIRGRLGALPLPGAMLNTALQRFAASPRTRQQFLLPADLADLRVENSHLIITFR